MGQTSDKTFKSTTELFYAAVRDEYAKMVSVKSKGGKTVFDQDYIFEQIGEKFFRSPKTIENIVFNRVAVKKPRPVGVSIIQAAAQVAH